ncbi:MAG: methionyl-tRNA formyltransferase [Flavobacterium sp. BFFFF2]|nr:MAG: methionyl-tRNA formyltransferase [Flavobacterium sp. BFFFF2]
MSTSLRIVFMGTPEFAVGIAKAISASKHELCGIVTVPDKPAGRGQRLHESAVKQFAVANDLPILQPDKLRDENFIQQLAAWNADVFVVVAFRMLPEVVWKMPAKGAFNLHASLLPQYRGAAPINWAIINGETETGVTSFFIDEHIDTGAMLLHQKVAITPTENAGQLHDRLQILGISVVLDTLEGIGNESLFPKKQLQESALKMAPKLNRENTKIDLNAAGETINNLIRGLNPYPGAWLHWNENDELFIVKIFEAEFVKQETHEEVGMVAVSKNAIEISLGDGVLFIHALQFPGKRKMSAKEFCNGYAKKGAHLKAE